MVSLVTQAQSAGSSAEAAFQTGSFVQVESGKIYYEECGSGAPTVVLTHDCGHLMYLEKPEEFTNAVTGFIESHYQPNRHVKWNGESRKIAAFTDQD
jgi:pimeloyl-ACP methyl ester carboxylesterase